MALSQISQDFLHTVFGHDWADKAILAYKTPEGKFRHVRAGLAKDIPEDTDLYWCIASFPFGSDVTRTLERAEDIRSLVIDDVGTKVRAEDVETYLGSPMRKVVTSEGNEQWSWRLGCRMYKNSFAEMRKIIGTLLGATDGMDAVHLFRLPQGINTKQGRNNWQVTLNTEGLGKDFFRPRGLLNQFGWDRSDLAIYPEVAPETGKVKNIRALVSLLHNSNDTTREQWIRTCYQIAALCETEEEGRRAWEEYSERWTGGTNLIEEVVRVWKSVWGKVRRTSGQELKAAAAAADLEAFTELQNKEAADKFDDAEKPPEPNKDGYLPTHVNMRDMILRREKGWLGWLTNAPQRWAEFDGALGRWSIGETDAAMRSAVRKEIEARRKLPMDPKIAKEMSRAAWALAVHALLKHHSMLEIPRHQFNADPDLLGVPNGALRLGLQLQMEDGRPDHMLSKAVRYRPGPRKGVRPEWDRFILEFCSGDKSLVTWLQTFCGYCLTGHTTEHIMVFLYGPGGNGKSLFLDTVGAVLGDYHVRADHRLFMAKNGNFHLAPLAALEGARLVTCPDVMHNATWDMGLVKLVTGGGSITANYMRENPFSFFPECKLMLGGNDKPKLESVDEGVRRRLRLIPCMHTPANIDRGLPDKLLREGEGIMRWMLDGWEMWSQFGLPACEVVDTATDEYLTAADVFGRWIKEEIIAEKNEDKVRVGDLWRAWDAFKAREGSMRSYPLDQGALSTRLRELGIGGHGRDNKGSYFKNIKLKKVPEEVF